MTNPAEILADNGPLAHAIEGFQARPQQQEMATAVARALARGHTLIAEAGTGTGKTFAYLAPALLASGKIIISTGTKTLQDQLFHRDLPLVREALGLGIDIALLKGRANYLCRHRLDLAEGEGRFRARSMVADLVKVRRWSGRTESGDIAELNELPEDAAIWPWVTSTTDNCLGQECPALAECHVALARRAAQEADVVVVNHHLLFADMALKEEGFGELLPEADAFILDEAHQVPEVASLFFGVSLGSRQLYDLGRDVIAEQLNEAADMPGLREAADDMQKAVRDLRLALGEDERRAPWREVETRPATVAALKAMRESLKALAQALEPAAPRGQGLESCFRRSRELIERLDQMTVTAADDYIHWFETRSRGFSLNLTPLEVATPFRERMRQYPGAWIFTSATLSVGGSFDHFAGRLGLDGADTLQLDSPFDYRMHAVLYVPEGLPQPGEQGYTRAVVEAALPVLEASHGRAFLLFTSHRALREAAELLENRIDYPLLVQGSAPRGDLLERFREHGNAVLLGTGSFWEGVDVRGEALSCVIIDKLPFASPGDPVLAARIDALRNQGENPFLAYQVPSAVITLKQGVGRLIRDVNDKGIMMLCDPRLISKPYGRIFLDSLPGMTRTRKIEVVKAFCNTLPGVQPAKPAQRERA